MSNRINFITKRGLPVIGLTLLFSSIFILGASRSDTLAQAPSTPTPGVYFYYFPLVTFSEEEQVVISPTGNDAVFAEGAVQLSFPAGAVDQPTTIQFSRLPSQVVPGYQGAGMFFTLTAQDEQGNSISYFGEELSITVKYEQLSGLDENNLDLYYSRDNVHWIFVPSTVDTGANQVSAQIRHFTSFAVLAATTPKSYQVGVGPDVPTNDPAYVPPYVTDAFRTAYNRNNFGGTISHPFSEVHDWAGAWIQDFDWASIIYNANNGTAYYIQGEYISAYVNNGGPAGFLGLPTSDRFDPPDDALLMDKHTDFMQDQDQIQTFENGFIGNDRNDSDGAGYKAVYYYPIIPGASVQVEHYPISDPADPNKTIIKAKVTLTAERVKSNPPQNDQGIWGIWIESDEDRFDGWMPNEGNAPKVWDNLEPTGNFSFRLEAWSKTGLAGYLACDSYKNQDNKKEYLYAPIPLDTPSFYSYRYTCSGFGGGGGGFLDTEPPVIGEPEIWQNGMGWAVIEVNVSDNVAVARVKVTLNGEDYLMTLQSGNGRSGTYAVVVPLKLGKNTFVIEAADTSGNIARKPASGVYEIWSTMDGLFGNRPWMGYSDDPVNTLIGNFVYLYQDVDAEALGPNVVIKRWFNGQGRTDGPFGIGWTHNYDMRLSAVNNLLFSGAQVRYPDGHTANFTGEGAGFTAPAGTQDTLRQAGSEYVLTTKGQTVYRFNADGQLIALADSDGNHLTFTYAGEVLTSITDASGRTTTLEYTDDHITSITIPDYGTLRYSYADGRLISATDTEGQEAQYEYNADGYMVGITSPNGNPFLAEQTYDEDARVVFQKGGTGFINEFTYDDDITTTILDAYGNPRTDVYDDEFRLVKETDALGYSILYTYNDDNEKLTATDKNGNTTIYTYDDTGNPLTITDPLGNVTTLTYDAQNHVRSKTDALGNTFTFAYDSEGHLLRSTDPLGGVIEHTYNAQGLLILTVDSLGHSTETTYNDLGLPTTVQDALGNASNMTYDAAGHLLSQTDAAGNTATYQYNSLDLVVSVTDPMGYVTTYEYDQDGNLIDETNPDGYHQTHTYDENGRLVAETDWAGHVTAYVYDDLGRKTLETDALGNEVLYKYDAVSNLISTTDERGATTAYTYDAQGNLLSETDALEYATTYRYDALNRVIATTRPCACALREERVVYDALGRVIEQIDALHNSTRYGYDALGRETSRTDALGHVTRKAYDLAGNLVAETDALGKVTRYEYDPLNQLVKTTNRLGDVSTQTYDEVGRLVVVTNERSFTTRYVYDRNNRLVEEIDALGNVTRYTYDGRGNRLTATDALGRVTVYTYDANGNQLSAKNPRGYTTQYTYDALNRKVKTVDALGGVITFTYDAGGALLDETNPLGFTRHSQYDILGRRIAETDRNGNTTTFEYDPAGNLIRTVDALDGVTSSTFDANNNALTQTNALGFTTLSQYDALNRPVKVIDALSGISTRAYDALGRLIKEVDANGHATQYTYDAEGRKTATIDALNKVTHYEYDPVGNQTKVTDRNGHSTLSTYDALNHQVKLTNALGYTEVTHYDAVGNKIEHINFRGYSTLSDYDANNNLVRLTDALGGETTYGYDALDRQVTMTDANGHTTTYNYDAVGQRLAITLPEGQTVRSTYDGEGNRLTLTNAKGYTTNYTYDALNRQVSETDPLGNVTRTEYDAIGQTVRRIDANNNSDRSAYDPLGRLVMVVDALGAITRYTYDPVGNQLTETDANGHTTVFIYDAVNRLVKETNPLGAVWTYTYDPEGNLIQKIDANGQTITYTFDAVNQVIAIHYPAPQAEVTYQYDPNGNLIRMADGVGITTLVYDALDREVSKSDPYNRVSQNTYDPVGNRLSITYPSGDRVTYLYNANDWLIRMTDPRGGGTIYSYDPDKLPIHTDYPNGTWSDQVYDRAGRLVSLFNGTNYNASVVTSYAYILDAVGNRLQTVEEYTSGQVRTITTTYQYNARYEVLEAVEEYEGPPSYTVTTRYTYDPAGNRLSMTTNRDIGPGPQPEPTTIQYTYDAANHMLSAGGMRYTYDANGNRLTKFTPGLPPAQDRLEKYTYDAENRLTDYTRTRLQSGHVEQSVYNIYDGLGRRLNKGTQESLGRIKWTQYALDGLNYNQLVEFPQFGPPRITQLYRGQNDVLVSMDEIQGGGIGSQYWFATDGLGGVSANTKHDGQSAHEYFSDPYGQLIDENGHWEDSSSWTNPHNHYLLTGKEWDEESRVYYFGARFYDAETGVWLTQDPYRADVNLPSTLHPYLHLGEDKPLAENINNPLSLHRYLYVRNNPVNRIDPLGFFDWNTGHVERGDTLGQIARDAGVSVGQIVSWNTHIEYPDKIIVGMYLWLPQNALNAGKRVEAIRRGAGAGEMRWGKYDPLRPVETNCCGPIVDNWFIVDLAINDLWASSERSSFTEDEWYKERFDKFKNYANRIPHKGMDFASRVRGCGGSGCSRTVTLCDTCIDRSELGNIMFGFVGRTFGFKWEMIFAGGVGIEVIAGNGFNTPADLASAKLGWRFSDQSSRESYSAKSMCDFFKSQSEWNDIQDPPTTTGCKPCNKSLPAGSWHTKPGYESNYEDRYPYDLPDNFQKP